MTLLFHKIFVTKFFFSQELLVFLELAVLISDIKTENHLSYGI